ncbi:hypothetical protein Egran_00522 [Elaphomyces granulatus]|uniref:Uncharacterized protein n=1 Tax=Elaphomyces granulatus TaxID=519963 RepID=A0A232M5P9_9EURO|nr:hypothetical protein Egran_00522 [Elaphomyces granulatus]
MEPESQSPYVVGKTLPLQLECPPFKGQFVLKLYDRRFSTQLWQDEKASPWNSEIESEYSEFVRDGRASHGKGNKAQREAYLQYACHRIYKTEKEAYKNLHDIQGKHIPRLLARPFLQLSDSGLANKYLDCPGILLENIQGFPLTFIQVLGS